MFAFTLPWLRSQWLVVLMLLVVEAAPVFGVENQGTVGGQSNYDAKCAGCHGAHGKGDGWRAKLSWLTLRDLSDATATLTLSDEYLFRIIKQGGASLGKPGMPSWGQELTDREIKELIAYIRSFTKAPGPSRPASTVR